MTTYYKIGDQCERCDKDSVYLCHVCGAITCSECECPCEWEYDWDWEDWG